MNNPTYRARRGRHRRRWTVAGLLVGVPAIVVPYLLFAQEQSQTAMVNGSAHDQQTSERSGKVLDANGSSTADDTRIQQRKLVKTAEPQAAGSGPYTWKNAQVVGGGYVTGLVFNPREKGLLYARTDMGGAYRWDAAAEQWIPLTDWLGEKDWNLLGIDSVATDPVDPDAALPRGGHLHQRLGGQRRDPALHGPGPHLPAHRPALQAGRQRGRPRGGRTAGDQPRGPRHPAAGHPQERPVAQHRPRRDMESGLLVPRQGRGEQRRGHLLRDVRPGRQQDDLRRRRRQVHLPVPLHRRRQHLAGRLRAAHRPDAAARRALR